MDLKRVFYSLPARFCIHSSAVAVSVDRAKQIPEISWQANLLRNVCCKYLCLIEASGLVSLGVQWHWNDSGAASQRLLLSGACE